MLDTRPAGIWRRGLATLAALGARLPSQCAVCHAWPAQRLCAACCARFAPRLARCATCACVVHGGVAQCGQCLLHPPPLDACLAAVDYGYPWSQLLAQFKFQDDPGWATALAALMRQTPGAQELLEQADWVLPVPLAPGRLRHRGYNQALLLARRLAGAHVRPDLLLRTREAEAQAQLTRAQRLRNLRGAFVLEPLRAQQLAGRRVLLVDDVMTTGATLHAAAAPLREAGVAHVGALVLARTP
ncbi:MAG TPA: ComF family protein [Alicycliphilus sp.]|jgi:ComF family protein|nr:ComF family protein [Alicycliphilus sp.]MCA0441559.1 ComF family protein [Pseudomonadota bacterium]MBP7324190.1 ComF family protein [Alicycliphilus sp.]MBP7327615.1 ComF family protein [Alicycliphilus sp.]MBP8779238.1 ComF family protein [Alicycliphilus sp.]